MTRYISGICRTGPRMRFYEGEPEQMVRVNVSQSGKSSGSNLATL